MSSRPAVIVTGSSGLLGIPVCSQLAECGYEVFGFDRVGLPEPPKNLEHVHDVECDITSYENVRGAVADVRQKTAGKLASVVHMAAYYDFTGEDSAAYDAITVNGTDRLLNALSDFELQQFVFTSTMLLHEPCKPGERISEQDPLSAKWPYPESKIKTERLIREGHAEVRSVFLRLAGVYTDFGKQPTLVQQMKRIYEKDFQSHFFPGDTETGQSLVYLDDAVDAIVATVQNRKQIEAKTAILIGEPDPPSYETLQDQIGQLIHGQDWTTLYIPKSIARVGAAVTDTLSGGEAFIKPFMVNLAGDHYALDISRANKLLGWEPKHRLLDQLPVIIDSLIKNPDQWYRQNGLNR